MSVPVVPPLERPLEDSGPASAASGKRLVRNVLRGRNAERAPRFRRDLLVTLVTQVGVAAGGLLLYRLLALEKGTDGVAAYALVKQVVVFAFPAAMLGLQVAIPRYVALSRERGHAPETYLLAGTLITGATLLVIAAAVAIAPRLVAIAAFGDESRRSLLVPLVATFATTIAVDVVTGYYRGRLEFQLSAFLRVVGVAALPVVLVLVWPHYSIEHLMNLMAIGLGAMCLVVSAVPLLRALLTRARKATFEAGRLMLSYGSRRVPGDFAEIGLMSLPLVMAAHYSSLSDVAYLAAGLQLLAVLRIALYPVALVFLPTLTRLCAEDWERAREEVKRLTVCALHIAAFATPQLLLFGALAARAWLGPRFAGAGDVIRLVVLPSALYVFYIVLRSALDAAAVRAYNARNTIVALAAFGVAVGLFLASGRFASIIAITGAFAAGLTTLGILTLLTVHSVYEIDYRGYELPAAALLSGTAAAAAWLLKVTVLTGAPTLASLAVVAGFEIVAITVYVAGLAFAGVVWPRQLVAGLRNRSAS